MGRTLREAVARLRRGARKPANTPSARITSIEHRRVRRSRYRGAGKMGELCELFVIPSRYEEEVRKRARAKRERYPRPQRTMVVLNGKRGSLIRDTYGRVYWVDGKTGQLRRTGIAE